MCLLAGDGKRLGAKLGHSPWICAAGEIFALDLHTHTHTHIHGHIHAHTGAVNAGTELFEKKSGSATPSSGRQRRLSQRLLSLLGHGESFHVNRSQSSICDLISEEEIAGSKPAGRFGTKA